MTSVVTPARAGVARATTIPSASTPSPPRGTDGLGKQDFLKLLMAQLQNQDPMKPMEDQEFIAQLAQFSSLEQLQNLNSQLETFTRGQSLAQAVALVGKEVEAQLPDGTTTTGTVSKVKMVGGTPKLVVSDRELDVSQILSVQTQEAPQAQ